MENTVGDVPVEWYREEEHVGYDADGRRILKRKWNDSLEHLLNMVDDPSYWRKVFDEREDKELSISKSQVRVRRLFSFFFFLRPTCLLCVFVYTCVLAFGVKTQTNTIS
jgi:ribosome biogenesis protein ERB1